MLVELAITLLVIALFIHLRPTPSAKSKSLRHLPNPPSPKPRLPFVGHLHLLDKPLLHNSLIDLSKRYGPLYSLYFGSMPTVVVSTPELFKLFLQTHEASSFNTRFQTPAIRRLTYDNSVAMVPFGPYWKFIRKLIMNDLLNATTVNKLRPLRSQEIRKVLRVMALSAESQVPLNVTEELLKWTNSTISRMMLGEAEEIRDIARDVLKIFGEYSLTDFIWPLKKLKVGQYEKRIDDIFNRFDPVIERVIKKRQEIRKKRKERNGEVEEGEQSVVFLDTLLDFAEDETMEIKITKEQIKGLVVDFFSAGTDSTAVATEWALSELINNPRVLQKAREEVDAVVGKDRLVDEADVQNLPYIRSIVKETFRMHPPLPVVKRKCVQECEIDGYAIPEGALILFNVWAVGRDPKYWDRPTEFRPERFLENVGEGDQAVDLRGQHFQLLPFGSGRRMCPGVNLATAGMATLLASVIQCFDLSVVGPQGKILKGNDAKVSMEESAGLTVPRAHNLVCVPVARSSAVPKLFSS
uniref:2-hydroxyisoflavanone synthase n=1 Tax=Glycyrrhiza uralensis TaxID=74613 RepID=C93C2_GLYUR|nr:RecName: Full=2-hydroxyisoflavanone synthase; Short=2HI synthase; AltName: Full=Cytochrome P450 93C2; AltName: Full=Isoflavonoid synthase [Glycyrrhiza uralensis]